MMKAQREPKRWLRALHRLVCATALLLYYASEQRVFFMSRGVDFRGVKRNENRLLEGAAHGARESALYSLSLVSSPGINKSVLPP